MLTRLVSALLKARLRYRYAFAVCEFDVAPHYCVPGQVVEIAGTVENVGERRGTVYVVVLIADPFTTHRNILFDSDRDLDEVARQAFRRVRIMPGAKVAFAHTWRVPEATRPGVYDVRIELWTPAKLFRRDDWLHPNYQHFATRWEGYINVVPVPRGRRPKVFVSYSWAGEQHVRWVHQFAEELTRFGIDYYLDRFGADPGEPTLEFMEKIREADVVIPICSASYVHKAAAEARTGVRIETEIAMEAKKTEGLHFIPVVRDNPDKIRPAYIADLWYVDMDPPHDMWKGEPMRRVVDAIRKFASQSLDA